MPWAILLGVAMLGAVAAWRVGAEGGALATARLAGAGGALAGAAALINASGSRAGGGSVRLLLLLGAALLGRACFDFLGFGGLKSSGLRPVADVALLLSSVLLMAAAVEAAFARSGRGDSRGWQGRALWAIEACVYGGGIAGLWWWLAAAPTLPKAGTKAAAAANSSNSLLGLVALAASGAVAALLACAALDAAERRGSSGRRTPSWPLVIGAVGALALSVADTRLGNVRPASLSLLDAGLRWLAPLLLAAGALLQNAASDVTPATSASTSGPSVEAASGTSWGAGRSRGWRDLLVLALPCLVLWAMAWRLGAPGVRGSVFAAAPSALWWGPVLLALALARHFLLAQNASTGSADARDLQEQVASLKSVVDLRTHQLATLHSVTADLSDTFSCEHILSTSVERAVAALGAQAGAVWLNIDTNEIDSPVEPPVGSHATARTTPVATFVWRELDRAGSERRALDTLRSRSSADADSSIGVGSGVLDKQWSLVIARGHEGPETHRALSELHRLLESPGGVEYFEQAAGSQSPVARPAPAGSGRSGAITIEHVPSEHASRQPETPKPETPKPETPKRGSLPFRRPASSSSLEVLQAGFGDLRRWTHVAPIRSKGEVLGALGVVRPLSAAGPAEIDDSERALVAAMALEVGSALQNSQLYQEASRLADRDSLTDLLNHRAIQGQLNAILSRSQRAESNFAVVMMDLNNFKFFNDTYGHAEGDRVLRIVAQCLREACRGSDILGRFGGDEFIALLLDTDAEGAVYACRRIAARVEEEGYQQRGDQRRIPITLSFGAAIYPEDGNTALELLAMADSNLYEAKRDGAGMLVKKSQTEDNIELKKLKEAGTGGSFGVLDALVTAIDNKDHYTRRHSEDVTYWASLMARQLEFSSETQRAVRIAGLLHDVGKIAVPDSILRKPGRLADDEFQIMQQHPVFGALIVKDVPNLPEVLGGIRHHHERYDGKGYPDKLRGENIPLLGRLLAVPDCFSAMTTDRPYRKALTWEEALSEIDKGKGTQFDPIMADAFLQVAAKLLEEESVSSQASQAEHEEAMRPLGSDARSNTAAEEVARRMADPHAQVASPEETDAQFRPRSVADAEVTGAPR
jgi:diguanylate cyclase (GGDEF)-like protein